MIPAKFDYHRAGSLDEALGLLGAHAGAKVLAGGHSLIPMMKLRLAEPPVVIDIGRIAELKGIARTGDRVRVGALATHAEIASSPVLLEGCPLLAEAAGKIADPQVRNKGTIGGNVAHADPGSDLPGVLVALGATLHLRGPAGSRQVAAEAFFQDLLTTALGAGELLVAIEVARLSPTTGTAYLKVEHPASGYAICGAAAVVTLGPDGKCAGASLAFNGIAAVPVRADAVTAALRGKLPDDGVIAAAVRDHLAVADPLGDLHASGEYRVELARVYGRRALAKARDRARS